MSSRPAHLQCIISFCYIALAVVTQIGCGQEGKNVPTVSKAEAQLLHGVSERGTDICADQNWYTDGECDSFCPKSDLRCRKDGCYGLEADACQKTPSCGVSDVPTDGSDTDDAVRPAAETEDVGQVPPNPGLGLPLCVPKNHCQGLTEVACAATDGCRPVRKVLDEEILKKLPARPVFSDFDYCETADKPSSCASLGETDCQKNIEQCVAIQAPIKCPEGRSCIAVMRFSRCMDRFEKPMPDQPKTDLEPLPY